MIRRPDDLVGVMQQTPMATLRLFAQNLPPQLVQSVIAQKPDVAVNKGSALSRKPGGRAIIAKQGTWFITTEHRGIGQSPDKHLAWIVRLAADHWAELKRLVPDIQADMSLLVHDETFDPHDLPRNLLQRAVEIGDLEIEVPAKGQDIILNSRNLNRELGKQ